MREAIAQARDFLFTTRRNRVNCVKYICMKLSYVAQQVGNAYFYRRTEIKELSVSLWWMHEGRNLFKPVAGCGLFRVKWGNVGMGNVGQKRAWSFPRLCTQYTYISIGILQYINLSRMFHIFTYQLLILYANKRTALTWFKVWICKTERTSKLENPTSAVGVKSDNCVVPVWGNVGHGRVGDILVKYWLYEIKFLWKKIQKICASKWLNLLIFPIYLPTSWWRV